MRHMYVRLRCIQVSVSYSKPVFIIFNALEILLESCVNLYIASIHCFRGVQKNWKQFQPKLIRVYLKIFL